MCIGHKCSLVGQLVKSFFDKESFGHCSCKNLIVPITIKRPDDGHVVKADGARQPDIGQPVRKFPSSNV
jgi:hypothetical protein